MYDVNEPSQKDIFSLSTIYNKGRRSIFISAYLMKKENSKAKTSFILKQ